jgi:hypothetical protein
LVWKILGNLNIAVTELTRSVANFDGTLLNLIPQDLSVISASMNIDTTILAAASPMHLSENFTVPKEHGHLADTGDADHADSDLLRWA